MESLAPDTLTRYSGDYAINDLLQGRLSVSRVSLFNDPFESHIRPGPPLTREGAERYLRSRMARGSLQRMLDHFFPGLTPQEQEAMLEANLDRMVSRHISATESLMERHRTRPWESMDRAARFMCLTDPKVDDPTEVPMWAYYGSGHAGVRIHLTKGFLTQPRFALFRVEYADSPPAIDLSLDPEAEPFQAVLRAIIRSKSSAWSHEGEWRLMIPVDRCFEELDTRNEKREFVRVASTDVSRIDLGLRFGPSVVATVKALRDRFPEIEVYIARKHPTSYYPSYEQVAKWKSD